MVKKLIKTILCTGLIISLVTACGKSEKERDSQQTETDYASLVNNVETSLIYTYQQSKDDYNDYYLGYYDGKVFINEQEKDTLDSYGYSKCIKTIDVKNNEETIIYDCENQQYYIQWMAKEADNYYFDIFDQQNSKFLIMKYDGEKTEIVDKGQQTNNLDSIKFFPTTDRIWYLRYEGGKEAMLCYIKDGKVIEYKEIQYKESGQGYYLLSDSDQQYFYTVIDKNNVFYTDGTSDYELSFDYDVYNVRILDGYLVVNETYVDKDLAYNYRIHLINLETKEDLAQYGYGVADTFEIQNGLYVWSVQTNSTSGNKLMTCYIENNELVRGDIGFETKGQIYSLGQNNIIIQTEVDHQNTNINLYEITIQ